MLTIDVISDVICPWCFIGKRRLEKALGHRAAAVRWHPFQINPEMPRDGIDRTTYRIRKRRNDEGIMFKPQMVFLLAPNAPRINPEYHSR